MSSTAIPRRDVNSQNENSVYGKSSAFKLPGRNESEDEQTDLAKSECTTISDNNLKLEDSSSNQEKSRQKDEDTLGRLISPCLCKGTIRHVHVECLNRWRLRSQKKTSFFQCDECKYQYAFRRTTIAKYATNEFVLTIVTLTLFSCCVFLGGFIAKFFLYFNGFSPVILYDNTLDEEIPIEPMTLVKIFTVDYNHLISGFVFVGTIGFLQILFSLLWLGPFPFTVLVVTVVLLVGIIKAVWGMYKLAQGVSRLILERVELVILEVNAPSETSSA
ncbi:9012_t:CDS:2 [Ambispora gerdemannii]|uniref:9012_t:CDS:1 n=1 Tax=Ambispora gerdemannii TaxID=144530 RepID=A0A9N8Z8H4_9GLOM|nr:9012_t:CDS:2 [Ambispora gerdemannii]